MGNLVLSLFPGIGLLDQAFEEVGYCVVRGPDLLWGGDVHVFAPPPGCFVGVIGGPPCKAFSRGAARARNGDRAHASILNMEPTGSMRPGSIQGWRNEGRSRAAPLGIKSRAS